MKSFVFSFRVIPPEHTVLARSGGSVFDAAYLKWSRQWIHVLPGGREEVIPAPEMLFLDDEYVRTNPADISRPKPEKVSLRKKKSVQLLLTL